MKSSGSFLKAWDTHTWLALSQVTCGWSKYGKALHLTCRYESKAIRLFSRNFLSKLWNVLFPGRSRKEIWPNCKRNMGKSLGLCLQSATKLLTHWPFKTPIPSLLTRLSLLLYCRLPSSHTKNSVVIPVIFHYKQATLNEGRVGLLENL